MRRGLALAVVIALQIATTAPILGKKVDVGDRRFRFLVKGKGSPTVLFDAGLGDSLEVWRWVWPDVAKFTRVFVYDRAGLGRSDPGPLPRTSERIASELESVLHAAGAEGPYVLVGHSFGGLNLRLFASRHPDLVVGLILVEATPVDFPAREGELRSVYEREKLETLTALGPEAARDELEAIRESAEQVRDAPLPPGLPVVVLSSTREEESQRFREAWIEMQRQMAARLSAERHVITAHSGHYIQFDEPELVTEAIREVVESAR